MLYIHKYTSRGLSQEKKTGIRMRKVKVNVILRRFETMCFMYLNIARMFTEYLPRFFAKIFQFPVQF